MNFRSAGIVFAAMVLSTPLCAQNFPVKPIRMIVPYAPGGGVDIMGRIVAARLSERMGVQVVVENRGGAGTVIGTDAVAKASADGYTLLFGNPALSANPALNDKLPYDTLKHLAPVAMVAASFNVLVVHPSLPVKSVRELVAYAKANPQKINYASAAVASLGHLAGELLNSAAGIHMQHVPYKGSGQAVIDLLAGQVQIMFSGMSSVMPHIKAGKLRPLAVTGAQRSPATPDVPTIAEAGYPGFEASAWYGVLAPAATPKAIVMRLNAEILRALKMPEVKERLENVGFELVGGTPEAFGIYMRSEIDKWARVVKASGVKAE